MKKLITLSTLFLIAQNSYSSGFYIGVGSGINTTNTNNMIYSTSVNQKQQTTSLGNVNENSTPMAINLGYQFNNFLSTELIYTYSGNQNYTSSIGNFWGSQNILALDAIGYLPILSNVFVKGRVGVAGYQSNLTTYIGNPNTTSLTSSLGAGLEYRFIKNISLDLDYINYGLINPVNLNYNPCNNCNNIGSAGSQSTNLYLISLQYHF